MSHCTAFFFACPVHSLYKIPCVPSCITRGVLPYMVYIGMCGPKGYGFSAVLVINRVSILTDSGHFGHKLGWFLYSSLDMGMFLS